MSDVRAVLGDLVTAVDHVGIAVPDLDTAIASWSATFGARVLHREVNEEQGVAEAMLGFDGDTASPGAVIQLLAPLTPESPIVRFLDSRGPGLQQLALRVSDVTACIRLLQEAGLRVLFETPRRGTAGSRITFIHPKDAGGVLVELVER